MMSFLAYITGIFMNFELLPIWVDIVSVVSEEKIFFKFHPSFFLICIIGQNRQKFKIAGYVDLDMLPILELLPFFHKICKILILFVLYFKKL
jgi:hypothetical protein